MGNLRQGSRGSDVSNLQQQLKNLGLYNGNIDGIFGPQTNAAVRQYQQQQGIQVDGIVGPVTRSRLTSTTGVNNSVLNSPAAQAAAARDPEVAAAIQRAQANGDMSVDMIMNAFDSGDYSGMPFTAETAAEELRRQESILAPYYEEMRTKDKLDTQDTLGSIQRQFDDYLKNSESNFIDDKNSQDKSAADQGVLFSTGRKQKLTNLKSAYDRDQASKRAEASTRIGMTARDFQYKHGNSAANGLSDLYKLGSSSFDAMTPGGRVSSGGLSSVYNPSSASFYGRANADKDTNARTRASSVLQSRARRLLPNT